MLPEVSLRRPYSLFDKFIKEAKQHGALRAAVIMPTHKKIIEAVNDAFQTGLIDPVLIGPRGKIEQAARDAAIDISAHEIVDVEHSYGAIHQAMLMAKENKVGLVIRGGAIREEMLREMKKHDTGFKYWQLTGISTGRFAATL